MSKSVQERPEKHSVVVWRFDRLLEAGYDMEWAEVLSECEDIDLHTAIELLEGGCEVATALRILL